jgi:3-deoxy-D-manno-octulosonic-acid transferase
VVQAYLPYDIVFVVMRFLRHWTPACCILMETEVWPNLVAACRRAGVPVALVNARLSEKSLAPGLQARRADARRGAGMTLVAAQTAEDAARIRAARRARRAVTGSVKFDVVCRRAALATGTKLVQFCARRSARARCCCAPARAREKKRCCCPR